MALENGSPVGDDPDIRLLIWTAIFSASQNQAIRAIHLHLSTVLSTVLPGCVGVPVSA